MKARNNVECKVEEYAGNLPEIKERQLTKAKDMCFPKEAWRHGHRTYSCTHCGHLWKDKHVEGETVICPHCGEVLTIVDTRNRKYQHREYFTIVTTCAEFQVSRMFMIEKRFYFGCEPSYWVAELMQNWQDDTHKRVVVCRNKLMNSWYADGFNYTKPMTIKKCKADCDDYSCLTKLVMVDKILPVLRRNGYDGKMHGKSSSYLFYLLLHSPHHETLAKAGKWRFFQLSEEKLNLYWHQIKICLRNGYEPRDVKMWTDMVHMLTTLGKDVCNPVYICPKNLKESHDKLQDKLTAMRKKKEAEKRREMILKESVMFEKIKSRYFGISFKCKGIDIFVLDSIQAYADEGDAMHHCVFAAGYYKKKESLILSARRGNKRVATIELSLKSYKVLQCRAACNKVPNEYEELVKSVEDHKKLFVNARKRA